MKPVVQEEPTGCAIASAAAIAGITYQEAKSIANHIGIYAEDSSLWSEIDHIRRLLGKLGIRTAGMEIPFSGWEDLPDCALLSIKWHEIEGQPYWHWVVFVRDNDGSYVLNSNKSLRSNGRTDFGRMKSKWYIEVIA